MSVAIELPDPIMNLIEQLKDRPDESPLDVITRALEYYGDDYLDEETEAAIRVGLEEYNAGVFTTEEEMAKKLGLK